MEKQTLGHHIIYGSGCPSGSDEVIVFNHPNGIDSLVFFTWGMDYGSGIDEIYDIKTELLSEIEKECENTYQFKEGIRNHGTTYTGR